MYRSILFVAALACLPHLSVHAAEPRSGWLVAVSDQATASLLPPLPKGAKLGVLVAKNDDSEDSVHARAYQLRFATHFVYRSDSETPISAMYRERLRNHGATVIDLRRTAARSRVGVFAPAGLNDLTLAVLSRSR